MLELNILICNFITKMFRDLFQNLCWKFRTPETAQTIISYFFLKLCLQTYNQGTQSKVHDVIQPHKNMIYI